MLDPAHMSVGRAGSVTDLLLGEAGLDPRPPDLIADLADHPAGGPPASVATSLTSGHDRHDDPRPLSVASPPRGPHRQLSAMHAKRADRLRRASSEAVAVGSRSSEHAGGARRCRKPVGPPGSTAHWPMRTSEVKALGQWIAGAAGQWNRDHLMPAP